MLDAKICDGWLMVPYDGPELATIEIGAGATFIPAYLDWAEDGTRVAQIRADTMPAAEFIVRVNGTVYSQHPGTARR